MKWWSVDGVPHHNLIVVSFHHLAKQHFCGCFSEGFGAMKRYRDFVLLDYTFITLPTPNSTFAYVLVMVLKRLSDEVLMGCHITTWWLYNFIISPNITFAYVLVKVLERWSDKNILDCSITSSSLSQPQTTLLPMFQRGFLELWSDGAHYDLITLSLCHPPTPTFAGV